MLVVKTPAMSKCVLYSARAECSWNHSSWATWPSHSLAEPFPKTFVLLIGLNHLHYHWFGWREYLEETLENIDVYHILSSWAAVSSKFSLGFDRLPDLGHCDCAKLWCTCASLSLRPFSQTHLQLRKNMHCSNWVWKTTGKAWDETLEVPEIFFSPRRMVSTPSSLEKPMACSVRPAQAPDAIADLFRGQDLQWLVFCAA